MIIRLNNTFKTDKTQQKVIHSKLFYPKSTISISKSAKYWNPQDDPDDSEDPNDKVQYRNTLLPSP